MSSGREEWLSAQKNWYWGIDDIESAMEEITRSVPDLVEDDRATRVLVDRIGYAMNAVFLSFQNAIGQDDGGVASVFASGWDTVMAARVAIDVLASEKQGFTAWDGKRMPAPWDGSPSLDLGKVVRAAEVTEADVRAVVDAYVDRIASDVGIEKGAIDQATRDDHVEWFLAYLRTEAAYEQDETPFP